MKNNELLIRLHSRDKSYCEVCGEFEVSKETECISFRSIGRTVVTVDAETLKPKEISLQTPEIIPAVC